jgi:hypothetical protein
MSAHALMVHTTSENPLVDRGTNIQCLSSTLGASANFGFTAFSEVR